MKTNNYKELSIRAGNPLLEERTGGSFTVYFTIRSMRVLFRLIGSVWVAGILVTFIFTTAPVNAQEFQSVSEQTKISSPPSTGDQKDTPPKTSNSTHRFWDRTNIALFGGVAAMRALDYASTRNMQRRGREEILLPDDVVNNSAGFAALEAAGTVTSIGLSYWMHRTRHHKLERWISIVHIGVTGFGDVRNYSLKSHHGALQ